jgi:hypothetical protein
MAALTQNVQEDVRTGQNEWLKEGLVPEEETASRSIQEDLEEATREQNPARRNQAYAQVALKAARSGDERARDYADKIEDTELRKAARAYIDYELVRSALDKKEAERAARLARTGELTLIQRVWAYTESAGLLARPDAQRAAEILEDAMKEAERIGSSSADHARARVAIATAMFQINRSRSWELMAEAVRASNSAEGFTGEDGRIQAQLITGNSASISSGSVPGFDVAGIFAQLAADDFSRAVELAKSFNSEAPRAAATLAVLRTVLKVKKK